MKATSIFGGVQVFNILISIIRSKFVAVLLGPTGMGIMGLLNSTITIVASLTGFGLEISSVKDVAEANSTADNKRIATIIIVLRRLVWVTGLLGSLLMLIFSSMLSQLTFGNGEYSVAFIWVSVSLLLKQLSSGQLVVLQGLRKLTHLAKANLAGSAVGLGVTVPMYYFWGYDGIVPGIIGTSIISLLFSWIYSNKVKLEPIEVSLNETIEKGKNMLQMGFFISLSGILSVGASYIVRIFISRTGSIEELGLYTAGFAIINTYVDLIFKAMSTDYYPRLSAVAHENKRCNQMVNQQAEIAMLILAPILVIFLLFISWVVIILYSKKFVGVNEMIQWAALGMMFKAASWPIAFIFLAKGTSKLFLMNELPSKFYFLFLNLLGYYLGGLTGLGISFAIGYVIYLIQVFLVTRIKFQFAFNRPFLIIFAIQFCLAITAFLIVRFIDAPNKYFFGVPVVMFSILFSIRELDKRLGIRSLLKKYNIRKIF